MCEGVHSKQEINLKKFFIVQKEGNCEVKREIDHYNLDVIIAIGYRVQSDVAVRFRRWATQRLHEYIQKGFTMDDERLKQVLHTTNAGLSTVILFFVYPNTGIFY